jgi:signal transduction histidine kinase
VYEPLLDAKIEAVIALQPEAKNLGIAATESANAQLVSMERAAFSLVRAGKAAEADALLSSQIYRHHKASYAKGLDRLLDRFDRLHGQVIERQRGQVRIAQAVGALVWVLLLAVWIGVIRGIRRWRRSLLEARTELAHGQVVLEARVRAMARELTGVEQRERRRVASLLHDHLQQLLVAARLRLGLMPETEHRLRTGDLLEEAIQASRTLTVELNPPALLAEGFVEALRWLADWMDRNYALEVHLLDTEPLPALDEEVGVVAFNGVRELLFNVVKHAGTDRASLTVRPSDAGGLVIVVEDGGVGFAPADVQPADRSGLLNISRRVELVGGGLVFDSRPDAGCRATLTLPPREGPASAERASTQPFATATGEPSTRRMWVMPVDTSDETSATP